MKRKRMEIVKSRTYRRFFFSYVWVLIIPIMAFTLIYTQYYEKMYRRKILEQSQKALELSMQELQNNISELYMISIQNSLLDIAKRYSLKRDVTGIQIKKLLASQTVTHNFIESIDYYNEEIPDLIYTLSGTYSPKYYRQYIKPDGSLCSLPQYLTEMETSGWISSRNIIWGADTPEPYLQYVVKTRNSRATYWIFTISNDVLRKLLDMKEAVTILYNQGEQLYPFEEVSLDTKEKVEVMEQSQSGGYIGDAYGLMYSSMDDNRLSLVRMIRNDYLFLESNQFRATLLMVVMLLLVLGGTLVAFLSFYNNKPINELEIFCENKFGDIPENIKGLDVFRFTLDKMEEKVALLEQNQKVERLLLQMIYGKNCNTDHFKELMVKSDLFTDSRRFQVISVHLDNEIDHAFNLSLYFEMLLDKDYELHMIEYAKQNVIIGIIGMKEENEARLKEQLNVIAEKISAVNSKGFYIYVGGSCDKVEDIHWSYMQALLLSHMERNRRIAALAILMRMLILKCILCIPNWNWILFMTL